MKTSDAIDGYLLFKSQRAASTTLKTDRVLLGQFAAWLDNDPQIDTLTTENIRDYLLHQKERGLSPYTIIRHRAILSHLFEWLASDHNRIVDKNIVRATLPPKKPRRKVPILTEPEINAIIEAAREGGAPRRDEALIRFMLDAGTRATETCRLQRADLDLKSGRARVVGKGNKERFVYVGTRALHSVWLYLNTERPACKRIGVNPVFVTVSGYPLDRTSLRHILDRLGRRADVPRLHPHLLRHTCAVERLRNGMNLEFLREFLGHESLETTRQYLTGLQDEDIEAGAARTSVGDNWRL